jgi:N-methylhydantoinase B
MYGAPNDHLEGLFAGTGAEMPNAIGLAGGMPGAAIRVARIVDTDIKQTLGNRKVLPESLDTIHGKREILCCKHVRTPMAAGDVWYHSWQAGGGYGDPLTREAQTVADDVARRVVSAEAARDIYGVVLQGTKADSKGTAARRAALRQERLAKAGAPQGDAELVFTGRGKHRYGDAFELDFDKGAIRCGSCGHVHGKPGENLLPKLRELAAPLRAAGPVRGEDYDEGRFKLRQLCCAGCGALVDVQVALDGAPRPALRMAIS